MQRGFTVSHFQHAPAGLTSVGVLSSMGSPNSATISTVSSNGIRSGSVSSSNSKEPPFEAAKNPGPRAPMLDWSSNGTQVIDEGQSAFRQLDDFVADAMDLHRSSLFWKVVDDSRNLDNKTRDACLFCGNVCECSSVAARSAAPDAVPDAVPEATAISPVGGLIFHATPLFVSLAHGRAWPGVD